MGDRDRERWFTPERLGPTGGILTQAMSLVGVACVAATIHAIAIPEDDIWLDPWEGVQRGSSGQPQTVDPGDGGSSADASAAEAIETDPSSSAAASVIDLGPRIGTASAAMLFETGETDFIDARASERFLEGHIQGAFSVPYTQAEQRVASLVGEGWLMPERRVVVYCIGGECDESEFVVRALFEAGFDPSMVHIDMDGYPSWVDAGLPTGTGPDVSQAGFGDDFDDSGADGGGP